MKLKQKKEESTAGSTQSDQLKKKDVEEVQQKNDNWTEEEGEHKKDNVMLLLLLHLKETNRQNIAILIELERYLSKIVLNLYLSVIIYRAIRFMVDSFNETHPVRVVSCQKCWDWDSFDWLSLTETDWLVTCVISFDLSLKDLLSLLSLLVSHTIRPGVSRAQVPQVLVSQVSLLDLCFHFPPASSATHLTHIGYTGE